MVAPLLAAPLLLLFAIFFVVPFVEIMRISFAGKGGAWAGASWLVSSPVFALVFLNTLKLALSVTLICLALGYPAACFIAGQPASRRGIYLALVLLPFWTSVLVRTYTWSLVLGREGLLNASLIWLGITSEPQRFMFTPLAVHLGMVQILLPVAILDRHSDLVIREPGLLQALNCVLGIGLVPLAADVTRSAAKSFQLGMLGWGTRIRT